MSPSELAECRENLKRQWKNRRVDKELIQRAWEVVHRVATVLYQDFGAAKVAVFGSLAEQERFTKNSDIDIVVWGISYNKCLDALWETEGLNSEFKIDLIDFEISNDLFRERILRQAIPINRGEIDLFKLMNKIPATDIETGEIYEVNRNRLIQRISDERRKISGTVRAIANALQDIEKAPPNYRKYIERTIAADLVEVYRGIEKIFERIANEVDMHTPSGGGWHNELLVQMSEPRGERPHVISQRTCRRLKRLLKFRHRVNNIYRYELIYEKASKHAERVSELFDNVSEELDVFTAFLIET
jgi:predicted nucleotidyltransferase